MVGSLVSVLLPVYNGEASLRQAIESVLAQDYSNFTFIIVDNASTDGTGDIIADYIGDGRVRVVRNEKTLPRLDNFVKTFDLAPVGSRWLKFIGDDDRLLPGCLTEMVRAGELSERVGLVSSQYYVGEGLVSGGLDSYEQLVSGPQMLRRLLLKPGTRVTVFSPASLLVASQAYRALGGFRADLLHADSELFYRILNRYDLAFVHKPLTVTGYHSASGQAGSTARGDTFLEAYRIRYHNLRLYDNLQLSVPEVERIKLDLVVDSTGFILARIARGDFRSALCHLGKIPRQALYYLPCSVGYFIHLALKKIWRAEPFRLFNRPN